MFKEQISADSKGGVAFLLLATHGASLEWNTAQSPRSQYSKLRVFKTLHVLLWKTINYTLHIRLNLRASECKFSRS